MCWMALLSVAVSAQDFASRFLTEHKADSNLTCITISPKMMEEIMKSDAEKDDEVLEIISNLKSMQMLTAKFWSCDLLIPSDSIINAEETCL